jgi:phytanoyl-CoA hydroxylase
MLKSFEIEQFQRDGYCVVRGLAEPALCAAMTKFARAALAAESAPVEYEADVKYPGAPAHRDAPGGHTIRRLLQAYSRDRLFQEWALNPEVLARLRQLLGSQLILPLAHHNCIMTKQPGYSSVTHWHQDIRYWSFERPELVNVWLALGSESPDNGCLHILPGSHSLDIERKCLDDALFLRDDLPENKALLATQVNVELNAGDVLFFHCRSFHGAGRNHTSQTKFSLVFTYHSVDNQPLPGSRSAALPEIVIAP